MRVLVADDEAAMTRALEALLKREHYSVDVVNNGQDALDYKMLLQLACLLPADWPLASYILLTTALISTAIKAIPRLFICLRSSFWKSLICVLPSIAGP